MPTIHTVKDPVAIGKRFREAREAAGLSQRELAAKTPYTGAYISRIEAGARKPTYDCLREFAPHIGVSAEWLESGAPLTDADHEAHALRTASIANKAVELALDALHEAHEHLQKVLA